MDIKDLPDHAGAKLTGAQLRDLLRRGARGEALTPAEQADLDEVKRSLGELTATRALSTVTMPLRQRLAELREDAAHLALVAMQVNTPQSRLEQDPARSALSRYPEVLPPRPLDPAVELLAEFRRRSRDQSALMQGTIDAIDSLVAQQEKAERRAVRSARIDRPLAAATVVLAAASFVASLLSGVHNRAANEPSAAATNASSATSALRSGRRP